ncbi:hypothetical protein [Inquilinus limosus]|uniref:Uncharacterized protein n=1 Tax=Inquilinus limosus MP06 TaxID=1398085 RepID=A0A0A0D967_9PROT|nr:hypothetical protein [Inquilinus limosus]KGM34689.1 hypothetical protein P409_08810 [Inquilinus limosus MP06]
MTQKEHRAAYIEAMIYLYQRRLHAEHIESEANKGKPVSFSLMTLSELEAYTDPPDDQKSESMRWRKATHMLAALMPLFAKNHEEAHDLVETIADHFPGKEGRVSHMLDHALDGVAFSDGDRWFA